MLCKWTHTVRAAPSALRGFLQLRLETHKVIGSGAGVTQNDLTALLTHLTIVLMVRLIAVSVLSFTRRGKPKAQTHRGKSLFQATSTGTQ